MGLFDWLSRRPREPAPAITWQVRREGDEVVVEDGRGAVFRSSLKGARGVRVVPLRAGQNHTDMRSGWQVALAYAEGDALLGKPFSDWRAARDLSAAVCEKTELPLDELTERMFSRVGQYTIKDS